MPGMPSVLIGLYQCNAPKALPFVGCGHCGLGRKKNACIHIGFKRPGACSLRFFASQWDVIGVQTAWVSLVCRPEVLLLLWSGLDLSKQYRVVEYFSGRACVSAALREMGMAVGSYDLDYGQSMDFLSLGGFVSLARTCKKCTQETDLYGVNLPEALCVPRPSMYVIASTSSCLVV